MRGRTRGVLGLAVALFVTSAPAVAEVSASRLRRAVDAVVARKELAAAFWGVEVRSLATGRTLYSRNAAQAFRPASTMKLVTTAAALDALGPQARLRTTVETAGRLDALGRVLGDVYLVGRGDPELRAAALEEMAGVLAAAGVKRVEGRLVGHEGAFVGDRHGSAWTWEDLAWGYGAPVSALSLGDNLVSLRLRPGEREGDPAVLDAEPDGVLAASSSVTTATLGAAEDVRLERAPGSDAVRLSGSLPISGGWDGELAVSDPARHAAAAFAATLAARGIRLTGGVATTREPLPVGMRVLAEHESPTVAEMIRVVNKESQNLHAEMLLRLAGAARRGEGSAAKGHEAVIALLDRLGVPHEGWNLADGSGLARTNLVTPHGLVALLAAMDAHPHAGAFRESLAVAGRDGTLEKRMRGTAAEGNVAAKTGTLSLVNALAGYATTPRGERLAFVLMVNNHAGRGREALKALDDAAAAIAASR